MFKRISILAALVAILALASPVVASAVPPSWSAPIKVDTSGFGIDSVSCPETQFCAGVDHAGNALIYNGSSWKTYAGIDSKGELLAVSCPSKGFCVAVGEKGYEVTYKNGTWSAPVEIDEGRILDSVSCVSETLCVAVDNIGHAVTLEGTTWAKPVDIENGTLDSVSCASETQCIAVYRTGYETTFNGSTWTKPAIIDSTGSLESISCTPEVFCAAVGYDYALTFSDDSWNTFLDIDSSATLKAVSCSSESFCIALDSRGDELTYKDGSWSAPVKIDQNQYLESVSCATEQFCVATDAYGNVLVYAVESPPAFMKCSGAEPQFVLAGDGIEVHFCLTERHEDVVAELRYALAGSEWCQSGGNEGAWESTPQIVVLPGKEERITFGISGLRPNSEYCFEAFAHDGLGEFHGEMVSYTTPKEPVPELVQPPTVYGSITVGQYDTEVHGEWSHDPTEYFDQWERCNSSGEDCEPIPGENSQTYLPQNSDIGHTLRVTETAINSGGDSIPASTVPTAVVKEALPILLQLPTITGTPKQGQTLTEVHGEWLNHPTEYTYQWALCNASGENCEAIAGATDQTYLLTAADVGQTLNVTETAKNSTGFNTSTSATTAAVQAEPAPKEKETEKGGGGNTQPTSFTAIATASVPATATATVSCPSGSASSTVTATASASASGSGSATSTVSQQDAQNKANAAAKANAEANARAAAKASAEAKASGECKPPSPVFECHVPKLKGKTLTQARKLLAKDHCKLGKVTQSKVYAKHRVVISQKPGASKTLPAGARVAVKLS